MIQVYIKTVYLQYTSIEYIVFVSEKPGFIHQFCIRPLAKIRSTSEVWILKSSGSSKCLVVAVNPKTLPNSKKQQLSVLKTDKKPMKWYQKLNFFKQNSESVPKDINIVQKCHTLKQNNTTCPVVYKISFCLFKISYYLILPGIVVVHGKNCK